MISNVSMSTNISLSTYPALDNQLGFTDYIKHCQTIIKSHRPDLTADKADMIIHANSPFELYPDQPIRSGEKIKYGALLIHGLLDCPFSLRDIGTQLQANGILAKAILLPGHGTMPADLLDVSYQDWIQAVHYGLENIKKEVEHVFLMGYSTGATLSVYHALQDTSIKGIILLSPAIQIKAPVNLAVAWHKLTRWLGRGTKGWMYREAETDYAKYQSIPFNAITQVAQLTQVIRHLQEQRSLDCPIYMIVSREDETISSHTAINFFSRLPNPHSQLLLYTSMDHRYPDPRITTRMTIYPDYQIKHFSHASIPFSPDNYHYGIQGDYLYASRPSHEEIAYGAYNRIEAGLFNTLFTLGLTAHRRQELTYNPDFEYMTKSIAQFIQK